MYALEINNLYKSYKDVDAVKGVSFNIKKGEIFTLVGPNGAGKTTTVEICEGIRKPDKGELEILGRKSVDMYVKNHIGVTLQQGGVFDNLTAIEVLRLFRSMYDKGYEPIDALKLVKLEDKANSLITEMSGGQKRRLQIAMAIINDPDLIFLDEPTTGLDPSVRRELWKIITDFKAKGKSIFLTTHYMDEAEKLSDRVGFLLNGELIELDTPENLINNSGIDNSIYIHFDKNGNDIETVYEELRKTFGKVYKKDKGYEIYTVELEDSLKRIFDIFKKNKLDIKNLNVKHPSLEDLFLLKTGKKYNMNGDII